MSVMLEATLRSLFNTYSHKRQVRSADLAVLILQCLCSYSLSLSLSVSVSVSVCQTVYLLVRFSLPSLSHSPLSLSSRADRTADAAADHPPVRLLLPDAVRPLQGPLRLQLLLPVQQLDPVPHGLSVQPGLQPGHRALRLPEERSRLLSGAAAQELE